MHDYTERQSIVPPWRQNMIRQTQLGTRYAGSKSYYQICDCDRQVGRQLRPSHHQLTTTLHLAKEQAAASVAIDRILDT